MNRRTAVLLVFLLVLVGIIIIGKQKEQAIQLEQVEMKAANELRRVSLDAQKAKQQAFAETRRIEAEAQRAKQAALEKARRAEAEAQKAKEMAQEAVRQKATEIQAKINDFVAQAKALIDGAEYQKAIDIAQKIFALDPNSDEAKLIIEQAKAKLQEAVKEKVGAVADMVPAGVEAPAVPGE
jgi:tetratricopeptide (TPR) repeat protein